MYEIPKYCFYPNEIVSFNPLTTREKLAVVLAPVQVPDWQNNHSHWATDITQMLSPLEDVSHCVLLSGNELSGALFPPLYWTIDQPPELIVMPAGQVAIEDCL